MKIKDLSINERPRERMLQRGPKALSNSELIAILLRSGIPGESAVDLASRLLSYADGKLTDLSRMGISQYQSIKGLGGTKCLSLIAAFELGRRFILEKNTDSSEVIVSARQIYSLMIPELKGLMHEECWVLFMNRANKVISKNRMTVGGLSSTVMDVKALVKAALDCKASSMVLVHNHPSGNPRPGAEDIRQTAMLKQAVSSFDISLIDHVVVCDDCFFSFADETVEMAATALFSDGL